MSDFLGSNSGYIENMNARSQCQYCPYSTGADYAKIFNLNEEDYAWRDVSAESFIPWRYFSQLTFFFP